MVGAFFACNFHEIQFARFAEALFPGCEGGCHAVGCGVALSTAVAIVSFTCSEGVSLEVQPSGCCDCLAVGDVAAGSGPDSLFSCNLECVGN